MNTRQKQAFETCLLGHNVVITGQAGTGKSYTVSKIAKGLHDSGKKCFVTCTTGIATRQYTNHVCEVMTLHRWCGLKDGRYSAEEIIKLLDTDAELVGINKRIQETDCLIIDEVSMLSSKLLSTADLVSRGVRKSKYAFGGIQVVMAGDFYQLCPVKNVLYGDYGHYAFEAKVFKDAMSHHIDLTQVVRQDEPELIRAVNELEQGNVSDETAQFIDSLQRPLPPELAVNTVKLFSRNYSVEIENYNMLSQMPGAVQIYRAEDEGEEHFLKRLPAQKELGLKLGAPVMLLQNLSNTLVNGLQGRIQCLEKESITVKFTDGEVSIIERKNFSVFDPVSRKTLAQRLQFPLRLSFAITVHKAQGMSLRAVEIDCSNAFQAGQIGVAVGRAVSCSGLRVLNFSVTLCPKHPKIVDEFYNSEITFTNDDFSCCRKKCLDQINEEEETVSEAYESDWSDYDEDELSEICRMTESTDRSLNQINVVRPELENNENMPEISMVLDEILEEYSGTPKENDAKHIIRQLDRTRLHDFCVVIWNKVANILENCLPKGEKNPESAHWVKVGKQRNTFMRSKEYSDAKESVLSPSLNIDPLCHVILSRIMVHLEKNAILELERAQSQQTEKEAQQKVSGEISDAGRAKIRYVGGSVVGKCKYYYIDLFRARAFTVGNTEMNYISQAIRVVEQLECTYQQLLTSSDLASLQETLRKQNIKESLINITDPVFEFFLRLDSTCNALQTTDLLKKYPKTLFDMIREIVLKNTELRLQFLSCLTDKCYISKADTEDSECIVLEIVQDIIAKLCVKLEVYERLVEHYLRIKFAQFRKDVLNVMQAEKKKAHRKQIKGKIEDKKLKTKLNIESVKDDKSTDKLSSHLRLKLMAIEDSTSFSSTNFKKADLKQLFNAYNIPFEERKKKETLSVELALAISSFDSMPNPETFSGTSAPSPVAGPSCEFPIADQSASVETETKKSGESKVRKRKKPPVYGKKGKGKGKKSKTSTKQQESESSFCLCVICDGKYEDDEDGQWIGCDACSGWLHQNCSGLTEEEFEAIKDTEEVYVCPLCR